MIKRLKENEIDVKTTFKTEQGTVKFEGELTQEEADYVISVGLNFLLQNGAIPFVEDDEEDSDGETLQ